MLFRNAGLILLALLSCVARAQKLPADRLIDEAHYLRARPLVQAALARNPNDLHALVERSVLEWAFAHYDEAVVTAERALALNTSSPEAHVQLTNALGAKLVASNAGNFEKLALARRFHKEADIALQLDPKSLDALEDAARFYHEAPGMVGGDKARATELAARVAALDPARGAALKMGFLGQSEKAAAEALWRAAVNAAPDSYDAHLGLAAILFDRSPKNPEAEAEARRALALIPSRAAAYRQLSIVLATEVRWDDLDKLLKQARAAVPDDLSPAYHAGRVILSSNARQQLPLAEQLLRAYLATPAEGEQPSHAAAHWRLALVLEQQGHRPEAIQELQTALHEDPTFDPARKDLKRLS